MIGYCNRFDSLTMPLAFDLHDRVEIETQIRRDVNAHATTLAEDPRLSTLILRKELDNTALARVTEIRL